MTSEVMKILVSFSDHTFGFSCAFNHRDSVQTWPGVTLS